MSVSKNFAIATVCLHIALASRLFKPAVFSYCTKMPDKIYACDFEVFGIVQGVFFRKYTDKKAKDLGIRGWCMNTSGGSVQGKLEGPLPKIQEMKKWLGNTGSPSSKIERAVFSEEREISDYTFKNFSIKR